MDLEHHPPVSDTNLTEGEMYDWIRYILKDRAIDGEVVAVEPNLDRIRTLATNDPILAEHFPSSMFEEIERDIAARKETGLAEINHAIQTGVYEPVTAKLSDGTVGAITEFQYDTDGTLQPVVRGEIVRTEHLQEITFPSSEEDA